MSKGHQLSVFHTMEIQKASPSVDTYCYLRRDSARPGVLVVCMKVLVNSGRGTVALHIPAKEAHFLDLEVNNVNPSVQSLLP